MTTGFRVFRHEEMDSLDLMQYGVRAGPEGFLGRMRSANRGP